MSKISVLKEELGYNPKPDPRVCKTCAHFKSDIVTKEAYGGKWTEEKNLRCGIGGFAVKKMASCDKWERSLDQ